MVVDFSNLAAQSVPCGDKGDITAKVTTIEQVTPHDRFDCYETSSPKHQHQKHTLRQSEASVPLGLFGRSTALLSHRGLRRTPRFVGTPISKSRSQKSTHRVTHLEAVSVGISAPSLFATSSLADQTEPSRNSFRSRAVCEVSQGLLSDPLQDDSATLPPSFLPPRYSSRRPDKSSSHPFVHISKHTHSAILWALEVALRHTSPFTPDLIEENAPMSELRGSGDQSAVTNGFGSVSIKPTAPAAQTGSPSQGIKGPRKIMEERAAREAAREERKRQEQERELLERIQAENQARQIEEHQRRLAERRAPAADAAAGAGVATGGDPFVPISTPSTEQGPSHRRRQSQPLVPQTQQQSALRVQPSTQPHQRTTRTTVPTPQQSLPYSGAPSMRAAGGQTPGLVTSLPGDAPGGTVQPRNTFPHAFERWEALSAHWEGLTSFWIRKLQQHADEIDRDPVSAQLSRQVSDLSAAGANLFHAVVELQRLRASSERKFQRWFFETRSELERHEETKAALERALQEERMSRATAVKEALENEALNSKTTKRIQEMEKELRISKDEARRAWEELGRREQEERDRTASLQQGMPTVVGGVQVVPMTQGVAPSRVAGSQESHQAQQPDNMSQQYPPYPKPSQGSAPSGPSAGFGRYHQQPQGVIKDKPLFSAEAQSEEGYSEGEHLLNATGEIILNDLEKDSRIALIPISPAPSRPAHLQKT